MGLVRLLAIVFLTGTLGACASSGAVPRPFPGAPEAPAPAGPPDPAPGGTPAGEARAGGDTTALIDTDAIVETALAYRGVPYRNGGSDPGGFDCSGLIQYVFARHGLALPREVREQWRVGDEIRLAAIEKGDLIFFATTSTEASHVGMAIGGDEFVHAPSSRGVVRVEKFSSPYWARRIVGVRRLR